LEKIQAFLGCKSPEALPQINRPFNHSIGFGCKYSGLISMGAF